MKGVILAGGTGTRLYPNTKVTNKHLLPVYNKPMIFYPIENMLKAGITDILIMPGKDHAGDFAKLLGSGKDFNARFTFIVQDHAGGNAYPIRLIRNFVGNDSFFYIFGDNIIEDDFFEDVQNFTCGAKIFCKRVDDPRRFGVAEVVDGNVISIEEKPEAPKSDWAVIGAYMFDHHALDYVEVLKPSSRGEIEITDLNNMYIQKGLMKATFLKGDWFDTGTHESLATAAYSLMLKDKPVEVYRFDVENSPRVSVGFILYNSLRYLPDFLPTLVGQEYRHINFYALNANNDIDNPDVCYIRDNYPNIKILQPGYNTGFAVGHNMMITESINEGSEFYIAINFDMILEPNFVSELLNGIIKNPRYGSATGKIRRWDFSRKSIDGDFGKTNFIDTTGLLITKEHRFCDRGQGEIDYGQYDSIEEVFGSSGAAVMYRLSALKDVAFLNQKGKSEFFDELMFMYKEDVDLAYRLQWGGYGCLYNPQAVAYHDRTIVSRGNGIFAIVKNRWNRQNKYKEWSWLHHHMILQKFLNNDLSWGIKKSTLLYEIKTFFYILFFEPFLLKQIKRLYKMRHEINERKAQLKKRINIKKHIERWME